jgi:ubiquitin carboxyl-terminal hydrolase 16
MVTHKGGHDSGHYECFRRQIVARPPFSVPTPNSSVPPTPVVSTPSTASSVQLDSPGPSRPLSRDTLLSPSSTARSSLAYDGGSKPTPPASIYQTGGLGAELSRSATPTPSEAERRKNPAVKKLKRKRGNDRWWRISDDKIKEARTSDVLGMQREVYLLFYQRDRSEST